MKTTLIYKEGNKWAFDVEGGSYAWFAQVRVGAPIEDAVSWVSGHLGLLYEDWVIEGDLAENKS